MAWNTPDVYYQPEVFGLTPVGDIEWDNEAWQFHITAVWVDDAGSIFYATDSGCSCPSPFEGFTALEEVEKADNLQELIDYLNERIPTEDGLYGEPGNKARVTAEVGELIVRLRDIIAQQSNPDLWR